MADVCEAFRFFRMFSGLQKFVSIRVHSWFLYEKATIHSSRNVWTDNP